MANDIAVLSAVKTKIETNKGLLVTGLVHQGAQREIVQVTTSTLTPAQGYYFVSISITDSNDVNRAGFGSTTSVPPSQATYRVAIELSDYAIFSGDEEEQLYELMDNDFRLLGNRIASLFRQSYWLVDSETGLQFRLDNGREVVKTNLTDIWTSAAQYHSMLYARIAFNLIEECTDDTKLYPTTEV